MEDLGVDVLYILDNTIRDDDTIIRHMIDNDAWIDQNKRLFQRRNMP